MRVPSLTVAGLLFLLKLVLKTLFKINFVSEQFSKIVILRLSL